MGRKEAGESEYRESTSDVGEFAGWDPYVIWLCKQFSAPAKVLPADVAE